MTSLNSKSSLQLSVSNQWCSKITKLQNQDHYFKTKTAYFKDHQIINPRPQKTFLYKKNQASYAGFAQSCR